MRAAVVTFPGSNCDRDMAVALRGAGFAVTMAWHKDEVLPAGTDLVALPGGFSFGDYLRCGAIAARAPVMAAVRAHAGRGGLVLGVCNGFQILCEARLLPGTLIRNAGLRFVCRPVPLRVEGRSALSVAYPVGARIVLPGGASRRQLRAGERPWTRWRARARGAALRGGAQRLCAQHRRRRFPQRRVIGLMPHPERAVDAAHGGTDGAALLAALAAAPALA